MRCDALYDMRMSENNASEQTLPESPTDQEEVEEEEEYDEPKICAVCGDQANGYHFNALTCEGCKGFFRRTSKKSMNLRCSFVNDCVITKNNRRQCQACRFRKCLRIGMLMEMIMCDEEVEKRRNRMKQKQTIHAPVQLSPQQKATIEELISSHRVTFDPSFSLFSGFRPFDRCILPTCANTQAVQMGRPRETCSAGDSSTTSSQTSFSPLSPRSPLSPSSCSSPRGSYVSEDRTETPLRKSVVFTALPHIADLCTFMMQNVIDFAKRLKSFRTLSINDQIALLKGGSIEIVIIRFNMLFNSNSNNWVCGDRSYCIDDVARAGFKQCLTDPLLRLHHMLRKLGLKEEEYVLLQAIALFSPDRPGVHNYSVIDELHESLALTLKTSIDCSRAGPGKRLLFPKLMACLTEMRSISAEHSRQFLQIQDMQPGDVTPLLLEVVKKDSI